MKRVLAALLSESREGDGGGQNHPKATDTSRGKPWSSRDVTHVTGHALGLLQEEMNMDL